MARDKLRTAFHWLKRLARFSAQTSGRAGRRAYQLYLKPFELFEEVRLTPDASGPALLIVVNFILQTLISLQLVRGVHVTSSNASEALLERFYANLPAYVSIRAATLFVFWFILFIIFWFIMYMLGSRVEGFIVFSASGYILSAQMITFATYVVVYTIAYAAVPTINLVSIRGAYPQLLAWTAYMYRLDEASSSLGVSLNYILDVASYFGTVWNILLTALMFKIVGGISWKRAIAGSSIAVVVSWLLASIFRAAGML